MKLINTWSIISIVANSIQIIGWTCPFYWKDLDLYECNKNIGLGCMLAWWIMLMYILKSNDYKSMLASFGKALPEILRALISIIPLFIGYAFVGMTFFWESKRIMNFSNSFFSLFALMNLDMIWETYADLSQINL